MIRFNNGFDVNEFEAKEVEKRLRKITKHERELFDKSDNNISTLFLNLLKDNAATVGDGGGSLQEKLDKLDKDDFLNTYILELKTHFSRLKPSYFNKWIANNKLEAQIPYGWSYPSEYSMKSYYYAYKLAKDYPNYGKELYDLAEQLGQVRVTGGHNYPSDHDYGKKIIKSMIASNII